MIFNYVAKSEKGKTVVGTVDSIGQKGALALLKERGLLVVSLTPESKNKYLEKLLSFTQRASLNDRVNFTHQIATMVSAGLNLSQSLGLYLSGLKGGPMLDIVREVLKDVEGGATFSASLEKHPGVFPQTYVSLIRSGEASGNLDIVLKRLSDTLEKQRDFLSKVKGALIYPIIISVAMIGVFILIMVFVVPKLTEMYSSMNIDLPLPTKILIGISNFMTTKWYVLIALCIGLVVAFNYYRKSKFGMYQLAKLSLAFPIFGTLNKEKELTEFTRILSLLIGSGVPIVDSLNISSQSVNNVLYSDAIQGAAKKVEKGLPLSGILSSDPNFPPIVSQMVTVGQETGKMDEVLDKLSTYFEGEADMKLKNLSTALEPLIMVVLGVMVGALILSIILPIYKLTSSF